MPTHSDPTDVPSADSTLVAFLQQMPLAPMVAEHLAKEHGVTSGKQLGDIMLAARSGDPAASMKIPSWLSEAAKQSNPQLGVVTASRPKIGSRGSRPPTPARTPVSGAPSVVGESGAVALSRFQSYEDGLGSITGVDSDLIVCGICMEVLASPRTAVCGHTFCAHCLTTWLEQQEGKKEVLCPVDRKAISSDIPAVNLFIAEVVENVVGAEYYAKRLRDGEQQRLAINNMIFLHDISRSEACSHLVKILKSTSELRSASLEAAMLLAPRGEFAPVSLQSDAYSLHPFRIFALDFNMSAPQLHVTPLEHLDLRSTDRFLDIGTGTGVMCAWACGMMYGSVQPLVENDAVVHPGSCIHGIEIERGIVEYAKRNLLIQQRFVNMLSTKMLMDPQDPTIEHYFGGLNYGVLAPIHRSKFADAVVSAVAEVLYPQPTMACLSARQMVVIRLCITVKGRSLRRLTYVGDFHSTNFRLARNHDKDYALFIGGPTARFQRIPVRTTDKDNKGHRTGSQSPPLPDGEAAAVSLLINMTDADGKQLQFLLNCSHKTPAAETRELLRSVNYQHARLYLYNCFNLADDICALPKERRSAALYTKVHCGVACSKRQVLSLLRLLRPGGLLVVPSGDNIYKLTKSSSEAADKNLCAMLANEDGASEDPESAHVDEDSPYYTYTKLAAVRYGSVTSKSENHQGDPGILSESAPYNSIPAVPAGFNEPQPAICDKAGSDNGTQEEDSTSSPTALYLLCCGEVCVSDTVRGMVPRAVVEVVHGDTIGSNGMLVRRDFVRGLVAGAMNSDAFVQCSETGAVVEYLQCIKCAVAVGYTFLTEPLRRGGGDEYYGDKCFIDSKYVTENREVAKALGTAEVRSKQSEEGEQNDDGCTEEATPLLRSQREVVVPDCLKPNEVMACDNCKAVISCRQQLLGTDHQWRFIGVSNIQARSNQRSYPAVLVNAIASKNVVVSELSTMCQLPQGPARCFALYCAHCDTEIGWKFAYNEYALNQTTQIWQSRRYGLVADRVTNCPTQQHTTIHQLIRLLANSGRVDDLRALLRSTLGGVTVTEDPEAVVVGVGPAPDPTEEADDHATGANMQDMFDPSTFDDDDEDVGEDD